VLVGLAVVPMACAPAHHKDKPEVIMPTTITEATVEQLKSAQAKLTYLGLQDKPIGTVIFYSKGHNVRLDRFLTFQASPELYSNDNSPYTAMFEVTPVEFHRILSNLKPILTQCGNDPAVEFLSFTIVIEAGENAQGQEFRIDSANADAFYQKLQGAINSENKLGLEAVTKQYRNVLPK
jgi:hypothetical protein